MLFFIFYDVLAHFPVFFARFSLYLTIISPTSHQHLTLTQDKHMTKQSKLASIASASQTIPTSARLAGTLMINNKLIPQAADLEILPISNGEYAITVKCPLTFPITADFLTFQSTELIYKNQYLPTSQYFKVSLLDSGITDVGMVCTLVLFYKGRKFTNPVEQSLNDFLAERK
jgi:hypothetical protein